MDLRVCAQRSGVSISLLPRSSRPRGSLTISNAPRSTPTRTLLHHNPPSLASGGSSTNSERGFSSRMRENSWPPDADPAAAPLAPAGAAAVAEDAEVEAADEEPSPAAVGAAPALPSWWMTVGVTLRNILKPTFATISPVSLKSVQRAMLERARKSSIRRVPML